MVVAPLILDMLKLCPGQVVFVRAGVPHCYLTGFGVEILAASDNVLRCGLTSKAIEVEELLRVIDCRPLIETGAPMVRLGERERAWRPPAEEFQLSQMTVESVDGPLTGSATLDGPQIVLCTRGKLQLQVAGGRSLALAAGYSAFVTADAGPLTVSGDGELFRGAPAVPGTPASA
jgi:mannose-6-phosphate isomerase